METEHFENSLTIGFLSIVKILIYYLLNQRRHFDLVGLKLLLQQDLSEPVFHDDVVYKFRKENICLQC